ncbi:thioredoxin [Ruminococcaceae bacterium OttesenSCG-928-D13]|nr:thioredoxin [Ruminococcaceae bacterium OttesenSCG-928-D13]
MSAMKITQENFEKEVLQSDKPVLLDFWAPWCGPCRMVGPVIDAIAEEATHAKVGKVNVDEQQALAQKFGVMSIPTMIVFKDGKVAQTTVGAQPKEAILAMLGA